MVFFAVDVLLAVFICGGLRGDVLLGRALLLGCRLVDVGVAVVAAGFVGALDGRLQSGHQVDDLPGRRLVGLGGGWLAAGCLRLDHVLEGSGVAVGGPFGALDALAGHQVDEGPPYIKAMPGKATSAATAAHSPRQYGRFGRKAGVTGQGFWRESVLPGETAHPARLLGGRSHRVPDRPVVLPP